ncbi:hypothetical protein EVAR_18737_1 [Eumeta japonica]|uniref:Uncharacterized protein n=1 Tax=Eumeta variegata TaxID=151549 RepID=A0A4C1UNY1_EUMVA|nr:hypothetical protein EVAR_18737_1 [Eumeta japonica]
MMEKEREASEPPELSLPGQNTTESGSGSYHDTGGEYDERMQVDFPVTAAKGKKRESGRLMDTIETHESGLISRAPECGDTTRTALATCYFKSHISAGLESEPIEEPRSKPESQPKMRPVLESKSPQNGSVCKTNTSPAAKSGGAIGEAFAPEAPAAFDTGARCARHDRRRSGRAH